MATCKNDCLHHPVCRLPFNTSETQVEFAQVCHHFKNKADFVEVKHGEWVISKRKEVCICSNCKKAVPFVLICTEPHKIEYDFCPHCGAKMDGERKKDNG